MTRPYRAVAGAIAIFALVVQYWLLVSRAENGGALAATFIYVSYFTIITNWFGAAALILPVAAPTPPPEFFSFRPGVRTAATLYLALVRSSITRSSPRSGTPKAGSYSPTSFFTR